MHVLAQFPSHIRVLVMWRYARTICEKRNKHKRIQWIQFGVVVVVILIDTIGDVCICVRVCVAAAHAYSNVLLHQFLLYSQSLSSPPIKVDGCE